jgi:superfamily I DNA/RNA helicase
MPGKPPPKLWPKAIEVYEILCKQPAKWTELKHQTDLSGTSLFDILQMLKKRGLIVQRKEDGKYCIYQKAAQSLNAKLIASITLSDEPRSIREFVEAIGPRRDVEKFKVEAIRANLALVTASMPGLLRDALRSRLNPHGRMEDLIELYIRPQAHNLLDLCINYKELSERVTEEMHETSFDQAQKEFDKFNAMWKELQRP